MLDHGQRVAILELHAKGVGIRAIARVMKVSRTVVRDVLKAGTADVPKLDRTEKAAAHHEEILRLHTECGGNLVRVHEELLTSGGQISYQALTAYCRRHDIGRKKKAAGEYHFTEGEEMQHDTSPHVIKLDGKPRRVQTASLVLCFARMLFFQFYLFFRRFECKLFLTEALKYMEGACGRCMIDNTHVIVLRGTGRDMVPVPEMAAFGDRYDFEFAAHEKGDANRSARVERPFHFIEKNFLARRSFRDLEDANQQARDWCDRVNASYKRHLRASPRELYLTERPHLKPLPVWVPPVYLLHQRIVSIDGYVSVHTNRYSVPEDFIGRRLEVRETANAIEVYDGPRLVATHRRALDVLGQRFTLPEHRRPRGHGRKRREPCFEEEALRVRVPELGDYVGELKKRSAGRGTLALRRLLRMVKDYPKAPLVEAVMTAFHYGLYDLERVERMVLRQIARDFFRLEDDDDQR